MSGDVTSERDAAGRFAPGNRLWEARSSAGPKPRFADPDSLWAACVEYFEWVESNPLLEVKGFAFQGAVTKETFPKMRAMTIGGLCVFLDVDETTWRGWREARPDLLPVITRAEAVIYQQKFAGAAADLLNPNIIARELGLSEKREHTGSDGGPIKTEEVGQGAAKLAAVIDAISSRTSGEPAGE